MLETENGVYLTRYPKYHFLLPSFILSFFFVAVGIVFSMRVFFFVFRTRASCLEIVIVSIGVGVGSIHMMA